MNIKRNFHKSSRLALAATTMAILAATVAPVSADKYKEAQKKAKAECAFVRSFGKNIKAQLPKPHATWGIETDVEVACIDKVVELYIQLDPKKLRADELTGRFLGVERKGSHEDLCEMSLIQEIEWSFWVTYSSDFNRPIATTKINKKSCAEYGLPKKAST